MAGFRIRGGSPVELRAIPHPASTVGVAFGDRPIDMRGEAGCVRSGSVAAGLAFTWPERFALINTALASRHHTGKVVDPEVAWAWRRIVASHGRARVSDLAASTGWSRQRLWSRFGTQLGLTPKRAARLVRFDRAAHCVILGHAPARVAADCGYADQSHLHQEVRAFAGTTRERTVARR